MKKTIKLTESQLKNIIKKVIKEGVGMTWLNRVKIDGMDDLSDEEKSEIASRMGGYFNGPSAIEFADGEWYNSHGRKLDNVDDYEEKMTSNWGGVEKSRERNKSIRTLRNEPTDEPHDYRYGPTYKGEDKEWIQRLLKNPRKKIE